MADTFEFADELGPYKIVHVYEPSMDLRATVVVDNVAAGPAIGGLRVAVDVSTRECFRLARAMTLKNAAAGLAHGGGKSVMRADPSMPLADKEARLRCFASALRQLDEYIIGPDMGTNEQCMSWVHDEIGRAVGLPRELGGIPLDELGATGWGVFHATDVAARRLGLSLKGARFVIQGFGSVGMHAARFLADHGAILVAACDSRGSVTDADGLEVAALTELKKAGRSVVDAGIGVVSDDPDAVIDVPCDIWIPAARPDVIDESNVGRLKTKIVAQGANIPLTDSAEIILHERGVLCLPDFIANAGGVICAAVEYAGGGERAAFSAIEEKIRLNTEAMLDISENRRISPRAAAMKLAVERVKTAMSSRRWRVF